MRYKIIKAVVYISDFASLKHCKSLNICRCATLYHLFAFGPSMYVFRGFSLGSDAMFPRARAHAHAYHDATG